MASLPALVTTPKTFHSLERSAYTVPTFRVFPFPQYLHGSSRNHCSSRGYFGRAVPRRSCRRAVGALKKRDQIISAALNDSSSSQPEVFQGMYGPWSIDSNDVREVVSYRAGLVTTAVAFITVASRAFLPEDSILHSIIGQSSNILYGIGAGGLGMSLLLIHIYVTPIKRTLQFLWAVGVFGSVVLALKFAAPMDENLVDFALQNHWAILLVGPLFASLTGLVFKEGLCYGKLEAGILVFVIPTLLLGHLTGLSDEKVEIPLLVLWMALYSVFTARKFTQPIKDDLGDKSIFMFNALSEEEKRLFLRSLQGQRTPDGEEQ